MVNTIKCAVTSCDSSYKSVTKNVTGSGLHFFPKKLLLRLKWIHSCGADYLKMPLVGSRYVYICRKHFKVDDFILDDRINIADPNYWRLKRGVIPTVFAHKHVEESIVEYCDDEGTTSPIERESRSTQTWIASKDARDVDIRYLRRELKLLRRRCNNLSKENIKLKLLKASVSKIFGKSQIRRLSDDKLRSNWSDDDILDSVALHSAGPRAYRMLLKRGFPFPAESSLRRYKRRIPMTSEVEENIIEVIEKSPFEEGECISPVMFDEMKVEYVYEDNGSRDATLKPVFEIETQMNSSMSLWETQLLEDERF